MLTIKNLKKYYSGKKVLITGHTGFKGSYMCVLLSYLGAKVYGYALKPEKGSLYELLKKDEKSYRNGKSKNCRGRHSVIPCRGVHCEPASLRRGEHCEPLVAGEIFADIRDSKKLTAFVKKVKPDYIIHMAAQPLVLLGYEEPHYTYEVNVMGTVNLLEAIRKSYVGETCDPISILNVTTDKVYENNDLSNYAFKENDKLCGRDPYANSKSCSEIVTYSYEKSFFYDKNIYRISTARAGNVIGGGDLNENRIIPDCYRSIKNKKEMIIRNPKSIRPYQFVLEPLILYLNIMALQKKNKKYEGNYNIGPDKKDCLTTEVLTKKFFDAWDMDGARIARPYDTKDGARIARPYDTKDGARIARPYDIKEGIQSNNLKVGDGILSSRVGASTASTASTASPHESKFLRLDNSLIKKTFNYKELFSIDKTMKYTTKVYRDMLLKNNIYESIIDIIKEI